MEKKILEEKKENSFNDIEKGKKEESEQVIKKKITKIESGVFHDDHGKLLYAPDEQFESCCMRCDKELVLYIGKMGISVSVLLFSFYMLQNKENDIAYYTSTISLLLGHFLNNSIKNDKKDEKNNK
jgi:hypothetical protein